MIVMSHKWYDSTAETTDEELVYGDNTNTENNECSLCGFKGKTAGGLKTHVRRKHGDRDKSLWEMWKWN